MVKQIHEEYIAAGAEVIETNTFGANEVKLAGFGLLDQVKEINIQGVKLAKEAAGDRAYVAGSIGPLGKPIAPIGSISHQDAWTFFTRQAEALLEGGIDIFILETFSDIVELQIAVTAIRALSDRPIIAQMTLQENKLTLYGTAPEVIASELSQQEVDVIGLNCDYA